MAEEKRVELDAKTQDPEFKYQVTQKYMLDYVKARGTKEDQVWYCKLVLDNKKIVKRGDKEFEALDVTKVRNAFLDRFFPDFGKKSGKKPTYFDEIEGLLKELEG